MEGFITPNDLRHVNTNPQNPTSHYTQSYILNIQL